MIKNLKQISLSDIVSKKLVMQALPKHSSASEELKKHGAVGVLELRSSSKSMQSSADATIPFANLKQLTKNNCQVLILNGRSSLAVYKKKYFWASNVEYLLLPAGFWSILLSPFIKRYQKHRLLTCVGKARLNSSSTSLDYIVFQVPRRLLNNRKVFAPPNLSGPEILSLISNVNYVLLRAFERVETGGEYKDLDLMVADEDAEKLRRMFGEQIGTEAMDVYTANGTQGHDFNTVPYYLPKLAKDTLASAQIRPSGIRAPSAKYAYLTFVYHLLFHGKSKHLSPNLSSIDKTTFKAKHTDDLENLSAASGYPFPDSFESIENLLRQEGYFPGRDLIAFYAKNNPFVTRRYLERDTHKPGLSTFFVRRFPDFPDQTLEVEKLLAEHYSIIDQGSISAKTQSRIMSSVRGGNWYDRSQNADAPPVHWFICYDDNPTIPDKKLQKRYPHLDNAKNATLKLKLRAFIKDHRGHPLRFVHASDNTDEALEHIASLGMSDQPKILEIKDQLSP